MLARRFGGQTARQSRGVAFFSLSSGPCRPFHGTVTRPLLAADKFNATAAAGSTSYRVGSAASRTRRQQRRAVTAGSSSGNRTGAAATGASRSKSLPQARNSSQNPRPQAAATGKKRARATLRVGRFNRITAEKGIGFAAYLYVMGESMTLGLTYLFHTGTLPVGEIGSWVSALGGEWIVDSYLERGPSAFGVRLSPRLFLNYLVANACTYPLYRYQYAFCVATAPMIGATTKSFREVLWTPTKRKSAIPKAPSATP